jgi:hypothetical protein
LARVTYEGDQVKRMGFSFVRQNDDTGVVIRAPEQESAALEEIRQMSKRFGTRFEIAGDQVLFNTAA